MTNLDKELTKFLDQNGESGIELTFNLVDFEGVVADATYNPETNLFAYKLLGPIEAMMGDRTHILSVKQHLYEKSKKRLTIHSSGGNILIFRPCELDASIFVANKYHLSDEDHELLHLSLIQSVGQ